MEDDVGHGNRTDGHLGQPREGGEYGGSPNRAPSRCLRPESRSTPLRKLTHRRCEFFDRLLAAKGWQGRGQSFYSRLGIGIGVAPRVLRRQAGTSTSGL